MADRSKPMTDHSNARPGSTRNQQRQPDEKNRSNKELSPPGSGDDRTPDKAIGEVEYAAGRKENGGSTDKPRAIATRTISGERQPTRRTE
jgi:hypothetical protein